MGNKKNLNRKSKNKANNWRGIIKMRKQKTKSSSGDPSIVRKNECSDKGQLNSAIADVYKDETENRMASICEDQSMIIIHSIESLGHCKFIIHDTAGIKKTHETPDNNWSHNFTNLPEDQSNAMSNTSFGVADYINVVDELVDNTADDLLQVETSFLPSYIKYNEFDYNVGENNINDGLTNVPDDQASVAIINSIVPLMNYNKETNLSENQPKYNALIDHISGIDCIVADDVSEVESLVSMINYDQCDELDDDVADNNHGITSMPDNQPGVKPSSSNDENMSENQPKVDNLVYNIGGIDRFVEDDISEDESPSVVSITDYDECEQYDLAEDNYQRSFMSDNQPGVTTIELDNKDQTGDRIGDGDGIVEDISEDQVSGIETKNCDHEVQAPVNLDNIVSNSQVQNNVELSGCRIVNINLFLDQIQQLNRRHYGTCHFGDMVCKKEIKKGLISIFEYQCTICGLESSINSYNYGAPVNLNDAAVLGITSIGLGSYHLNEFCANLEIPCMNNYLYDKTQKKQQEDWWQLAQKEATDALNQEIELAILNGEVDSNGNALIVVVCDGSWPKRSYNTNFTSLSGCALLIGFRTNKVIYFDVKNKYCHVCKIAKSKNVEPREHKCNTNYVGPASGMETAIVIEGFRACEKMGCRFKEFVADGDSSSYKTICDLKIYQNPSMSTEKDDCCNHLYRNFRKAWWKLAKATKKFKPAARKLLTKKKGNDICTGIQTAAKHWRESNVDTVEKLINLEKDVLNAPLHYFGIHDKCAEYFCTKKTEPEAVTVVNMLKSEGLYNEILNLCQTYFGSSVPSLLLNYNNNWAECFNNLIAKYTGGKRINYCLAQSYRSRVARAVVQYNTGGHSGSAYHEFKESTATKPLKALEECRKRKCEKNAIAKASKPKRARFTFAEQVQDQGVGYGENCQTNDLPTKMYEIAKAQFLEPLQEDQRNWDFVNRSTIGQSLCRTWRDKRLNLLTSSYFSRVINARCPESYTNLCKEIIYTKTEYSNTAALRHQKIHEKEGLRCFTLKHGSNYISETGLFIDMEHCFLETSPFRLYGDNGIICVKCPVKPLKKKMKTIHEAIDAKLIPFWKNKSGVLTINENSEWYIEIQGQLHIAQKSFAFLVIWLESEFQIETVYRDDDFWVNKMVKPLVYFYEEVMIKELVDPRLRRSMPLRVYNSETKTFE